MELIFEIGTEEIPPSYIRPALGKFESAMKTSLGSAGIGFSDLKTLGTPRRLVVIAHGLAEKAEDRRETVFGPPANKAFDASGRPTQAAVGFAKSQGIDVAELKTRKKGKGEYVCVEKVQEGAATIDELGSILSSTLEGAIPFPKTMRWEDEGRRFARPIRWMTLVIDGRLGTDSKGRHFRWAGLEAGEKTRGHRFLGEPEIMVTSSAQYVEELRRNFVIVDHEERRRVIEGLIGKAVASVEGSIVPDEELLERVTFTVEYPLAVLGGFAPKFLEMPREVVVTALREHQDFFSVCDSRGKLIPYFVAAANTDEDRAGKIKRGNERVLKARLEDAHFYWEQDLKDGLDRMADRLSHVLWQEQLGSLREKSERVMELSEALAKMTGMGDVEKLKRAAYLSKADLTSNMVREKEFSALQGLMGREYASASGEDREVAQAIFEHYLPRFAGDMLPETQTGSILALADKLDTIVGCFGAGLIPTGSEDPFALRRQATGFVRILIDKGIHLDINEAIDYATGLYASKFPAEAGSPAAEVYRFLEQRLKTVLVDAGNRADLVDSAVPGVDLRDPVLMAKKVEAIKCFQDDPRFLKLVTAYKRAFNIWFSAGMREGEVDEALLGSTQTEEGRAEWNLYQAYQGIRDRYGELMGAYRFGEVLQLLLELATPVDVFFDKVMVMVDDEKVKQNRINLLGRVADLFLQIADFSKVEVG